MRSMFLVGAMEMCMRRFRCPRCPACKIGAWFRVLRRVKVSKGLIRAMMLEIRCSIVLGCRIFLYIVCLFKMSI